MVVDVLIDDLIIMRSSTNGSVYGPDHCCVLGNFGQPSREPESHKKSRSDHRILVRKDLPSGDHTHVLYGEVHCFLSLFSSFPNIVRDRYANFCHGCDSFDDDNPKHFDCFQSVCVRSGKCVNLGKCTCVQVCSYSTLMFSTHSG
jgi:hypothetical protein